jgi:hypothetical protein
MEGRSPIREYLTGGLVAGVAAAIINNMYSFAYSAVTGFSIPQVITFVSITGASIVPLVIGSLVYFGLSRFTAKATAIYSCAAIVLALASCLAPLGATLPDGTPTPAGFAGLTIPMHIGAGICAAFVTPRFVRR